jgi:hypothetical protein
MSFTFFSLGIFGFLGRAKRAYNTDFSFFILALTYHGGGVSYLFFPFSQSRFWLNQHAVAWNGGLAITRVPGILYTALGFYAARRVWDYQTQWTYFTQPLE